MFIIALKELAGMTRDKAGKDKWSALSDRIAENSRNISGILKRKIHPPHLSGQVADLRVLMNRSYYHGGTAWQ